MSASRTQSKSIPVLHQPSEVDAAWLESVLQRPVLSFTRTDAKSNWGSHACIEAEAEGLHTPLKLRVKIGSAEVFGSSEVDYYTSLFAGLASAPLVHCHHAALDATHYNIVLDDLSDSHRNQDDVPVTQEYAFGLMRSLASVHAHRWGERPGAGASGDIVEEPSAVGMALMIEAMQEGFTESEREKVIQVAGWLPGVMRHRAKRSAGYSWVHGDLNPGNILAPITGTGQVLLLDYQPFANKPPVPQLAMSDLAHAMVLWWPEESRSQWALESLVHWNERLQESGVGYQTNEQLLEDWRLCVAQTLMVPMSRCAEPGAVTAHSWLWRMFVRRALAALTDAESLR